MFGFMMFSVNGGACSGYSTRSDFCEQRVARQQHRAALPMKRAVMKYVEADKTHKKASMLLTCFIEFLKSVNNDILDALWTLPDSSIQIVFKSVFDFAHLITAL